MERNAILAKLQLIFRDFFDNDDLNINEDSSSDHMEEWDSVAHIQIILQIENQFNVIFEVEDIPKMNKISIIIDKISGQIE